MLRHWLGCPPLRATSEVWNLLKSKHLPKSVINFEHRVSVQQNIINIVWLYPTAQGLPKYQFLSHEHPANSTAVATGHWNSALGIRPTRFPTLTLVHSSHSLGCTSSTSRGAIHNDMWRPDRSKTQRRSVTQKVLQRICTLSVVLHENHLYRIGH